MSTGTGTGTGMGGLTRAQFDACRRDGFVILERFIDDETLAALRAAYDEILRRDVEAGGDRMLGDVTRQVMHPGPGASDVRPQRRPRSRIEIARQLFATDEVSRGFDMLIYKPPGHPHATPWHQDMAYSERPFAEPGTAERAGVDPVLDSAR